MGFKLGGGGLFQFDHYQWKIIKNQLNLGIIF